MYEMAKHRPLTLERGCDTVLAILVTYTQSQRRGMPHPTQSHLGTVLRNRVNQRGCGQQALQE